MYLSLAINIVYPAQSDNFVQEVKLLKVCPLSGPWDSLGEILLGIPFTACTFIHSREGVKIHIQYLPRLFNLLLQVFSFIAIT